MIMMDDGTRNEKINSLFYYTTYKTPNKFNVIRLIVVGKVTVA